MITKQNIYAKVTAEAQKLISQGFVITAGYQYNDFPRLVLSKGSESVRINVAIDGFSLEVSDFLYRPTAAKVVISLNDKVVAEFYKVGDNVYVDSLDEAINIYKLKVTRSIRKRESNKDVTSKGMVERVKRMKGFRSVPKKNIRVFRVQSDKQLAYRIENTASRNEKVVAMRK